MNLITINVFAPGIEETEVVVNINSLITPFVSYGIGSVFEINDGKVRKFYTIDTLDEISGQSDRLIKLDVVRRNGISIEHQAVFDVFKIRALVSNGFGGCRFYYVDKDKFAEFYVSQSQETLISLSPKTVEWGNITGNIEDQLDLIEKLSLKADLIGGVVPASQLPSYVDDVLEYDDLASFPVTGETGKIYLAKDTGFLYRWTGSVYVNISGPLSSWPIGSVYTSVINTNPSSMFGGTWVEFGAGKCLVGVDAGQTEFDTVEETGGGKDACTDYNRNAIPHPCSGCS